MSEARLGTPDLGVGIGLRVPHYGTILGERPPVDFFEIISENFMVGGGKPRYHLDRVKESYRVVQHGVSLGIGAPEPPSSEYLGRLKALVRHVKPAWVSDHFCWCGTGGAHLHELLPLPYTEEAIDLVSRRARMVQDFLEVRFALENTSSYLTYTSSTMPEWQFVAEVAERADVGLLLDVNNIYVSAYNHGFDPYEFVRRVPHERVVQIHVAGHTEFGTHIVDTHRGQVIDPVWDLYRKAIELTGPVSTLVEWDDEIPPLDTVVAEANKARRIRDEALSLRASRTMSRFTAGEPPRR
jgi:uncharacterized protein (UPF0276 family)